MKYRTYNVGWSVFWLAVLFILLIGGFRMIIHLIGAGLIFVFNIFPLLIIAYFIFSTTRSLRRSASIKSGIKGQSADSRRFIELLIHILVHVMKADHKVEQTEVQSMFQFFAVRLQYSQFKMLWVADLLQHALRSHYTLESLCAEFSSKFNYESKLLLLELLYTVATSDTHFDSAEQSVIKAIVQLLEIAKEDHDQIRSKFDLSKSGSLNDKNYEILGIAPGASEEEIKKAYKDAVKKFHPDKVHHLGEEFRKIAEERVKDINRAYEALK